MNEPSLTRRDALRGAAVGSLCATAGCLDALPFLGGEDATVDLGPVPPSVDLLVRADGDTLLADDGLRRVVSAGIEARTQGEYGPTDVDGLVSAVERVYGLDPTAVSTITGFSTIATENPIDSLAGGIIDADWAADAVPEQLRAAGFSLTARTAGEVQIYDVENEISAVGILPEGRYVVGTEGAVDAAVAVHNGEAEALSDSLLATFRRTEDRPVRFAARFPPLVDGIASLVPGGGEVIRDALLNRLSSISGTVERDGETRSLSVTVEGVDASAAEDFESVLNAGLAIARSNAPESGPIIAALEAVDVSRDGRRVTAQYGAAVAELVTIADAAVGWLFGPGPIGVLPPGERT